MSLSYDEWAASLREGTLLGVTCADCGTTYGTPFSVCNECGGRDLDATDLPEDGEVYSVTTVNVPPVGFEGPYQVALVQVGPARVTARIADDDEVDIGDGVVLDGAMEADDGHPAPVFRRA
ncbi:Zn-ribbon domain-containing OB-fold protein [Halomarina ordinaria]|uniref:Zn-ribbon domain-containing OB-fold protein n=1 Tax=Halomarina ordinaria TaxID=3033939 RepID=A0ABD5U917_9EURY|nr:OB-fold domain-containing protein [Halomarina sp. PSRA2]